MSASSGVQVVVRLRPLNEKEKKHGTLPVISASTNDKLVTVIKGTGSRQARSSFAFDNVFTAFSTQEEVFDTTLKPVIKDVLQGYESTVFAYGQTGTGKTHTMEGSLAKQEDYGVIPRSAQAIFEQLNQEHLNYESFNVYCSYLEIYNEDLCDLLAEEGGKQNNLPQNQKLEIMEGKSGPFVRGISEREVKSAAEVLLLMQKAQNQRKVGETNMNKSSSRSHCIFTMKVNAKRRLEDGSLFSSIGKLNMCDLAGSECAKTADMEDGKEQAARERERLSINRSLLTLGRVVKLVKEMSNSKKKTNVRIPYRDSKLTRILQQSLGGTCKTTLIATLSPSELNIEESLSTLNYAHAASGIINQKAVSSSYMSQATSCPTTFSGNDTNKGKSAVGTIEHWNEMECRLEYMQGQVEEAQAALSRKHLQQQELVERAEKAEADKVQIEQMLEEAQKQNELLVANLKKEKKQRQSVEKELDNKKLQLERSVAVLHATQKTEVSLTNEAMALIRALKDAVSDSDRFYQMLLTNRRYDIERKKAANDFHSEVASLLENLKQAMTSLYTQGSEFCTKASKMATTNANNERLFVEKTKKMLSSAIECLNGSLVTLRSSMNDTDGIIPATGAMVQNTVTQVGTVQAAIESSEEQLTAHFTSARKKITEFSGRLTDLQQSHDASYQNAVDSVGTHIEKSKENVQNLVSSTTQALVTLREERKQLRDSAQEILEEWRASSVAKSENIAERSNAHRMSVDKMLETSHSVLPRHENIETNLQSLGKIFQESQATSVAQHDAQNSLLVETQLKLKESHRMQNKALSSCVRNILKGVEELVETQMAEVISLSDKSHRSVLGCSNTLIEKQSAISSTAIETLRNAEAITGDIRKDAEVTQKHDANVLAHLDETMTVLAELQHVAQTDKSSTDYFALQACKSLKDLDGLDTRDKEILETFDSSGQQCSDCLSNELREVTLNGISSLKDSGKSMADYSSEVILANMSSAVDEMEKPRDGVVFQLAQDLSSIEVTVKEKADEIKAKASATSKATDVLEGEFASMESDFLNNTVKDRISELEEAKDTFIQCAECHTEASHTTIDDTQKETRLAATAVDKFVNKDLRAKENVEPAPERLQIKYSEDLSATPCEEEIFKKVDMQNKETESSKESEEDSESQISGKSSMETLDSEASDSNESVKGGNSSVLKSISPNEDNAAKKRSRKSISATPVKLSPSDHRKPPQRRSSKLALPKASSSSGKRPRRSVCSDLS